MTSTRMPASRRTFSSALLLLCLFLVPSLVGQRGDIHIGDVTVPAGDRDVIPIFIASDSAEMRQQAEQAFSVHGGYRLVRDRSAAAFTFTFRPAGTNQVAIDISSGNPPRSQLQQTVTGTSPRNALFRAADVAVSRTSGQPGFFAGRLTFVGDRSGNKEIYVSDLFMTEFMQITQDRSQSVGPRWAPDGQRILYTTYFQSGFPDIFQIDLISRQRRPFINMRGTNTGARFSPDGNRVAMILSGEGTPEVYVSNAAGRQIRRLTRTTSVQASPTWSPDGTQLAFTSDRDGRPQIFVMSASGGNMRRIPTNISGHCVEPDWNPRDPNLLAFTAAVSGRFAVAIYDFNTRQSRFVTQGSGDAIEPVWTNDGRHLIYTARTATSSQLMLLDTRTGRSSPLGSRNQGRTSQADFWIQR
jgi:TolB protein